MARRRRRDGNRPRPLIRPVPRALGTPPGFLLRSVSLLPLPNPPVLILPSPLGPLCRGAAPSASTLYLLRVGSCFHVFIRCTNTAFLSISILNNAPVLCMTFQGKTAMPALIISIAPFVGLTLVISCELVMPCCTICPRFHRLLPRLVRPLASTHGSLGLTTRTGRLSTTLGSSLL